MTLVTVAKFQTLLGGATVGKAKKIRSNEKVVYKISG